MIIESIQTTRLSLRPLSLEDADGLFQTYLSDPRAAKYLSWDACATAEDAHAVVEGWFSYAEEHPTYACWTVYREGRSIGTVVLNEGDLGYGFGSAFWGKGYATEAADAVVRYAFDKLGFNTLCASRDVHNERSGHVLEKLGMQYKETRDGCVRYEMTRNGGLAKRSPSPLE